MDIQPRQPDPKPAGPPTDIPAELLQLFYECFWGTANEVFDGGSGHSRDADWARLLHGISESVEQHPNCAQAWCRLGDLFGLNGETEEAGKCFAKALEVDPLHAEAAIEVGTRESEDGGDPVRIRQLLEIGLRHLPSGHMDEETLLSDIIYTARDCGFHDLAMKAHERGKRDYPDGYWPEE